MFALKEFIKDKFIDGVYAGIKKYNLIKEGDTVIAALSGGADSVALLITLAALREKLGVNIISAHLNHMIRGEEAVRDENFAKKISEELNIPCKICHRDILSLSNGKNTEEVGRRERYRFFNEIASEYEHSVIAVAHNKNDLAETMLMRMARGSSLVGLSGIKIKNNNVVRPLLYTSRAEIESFLERCGTSYMTDSTNLTDDYTRNKVRHKILPLFEELNPDFISSSARTARKLASSADFIAECAKKSYGEITNVIKIDRVKHLHRALQEYIISEAAYCAEMSEISDKNISDILSLSDTTSGKKVCLPLGYEAVRLYDEIKIGKRIEEKSYCYELKEGNNYIKEADYTVTIEKSARGIDLDKLKLPLYARPKKEGEVFLPVGMDGEKKLKRLFVDSKLPMDKRCHYPIITDSENIIFVLGRADKRVVSDSFTKNAITIKITEGELK